MFESKRSKMSRNPHDTGDLRIPCRCSVCFGAQPKPSGASEAERLARRLRGATAGLVNSEVVKVKQEIPQYRQDMQDPHHPDAAVDVSPGLNRGWVAAVCALVGFKGL